MNPDWMTDLHKNMKWTFWKSKPVTPQRFEVVPRDRCEIRLTEWQTNSRLTSGANAALRGDFIRLGLDVLRNEHPGNMVLPFTADPDTRAAHQARCEGYTMALANLEALAHFKEEHKMPEPMFEPEEKPE